MLGIFKKKTEMEILVEKALKVAPEITVQMIDEIKAKADRIYHMTSIDGKGGWGNKIAFFDEATNMVTSSVIKLVGFKSEIPRKDDVVLSRLKSGKISLFVIKSVERCGNPRDMFFAEAVLIGYDINFVEGERERL